MVIDRVETVVVGADVVDLGVARALALAGREMVLLEAGDAIGTDTSSRNSEIIHADLYYPPETVAQLARLARGVAAARGGEVTAAAFRDATGLGRKRAIQILEYFDRIGLLRRVGDVHRLRGDSTLFLEERAA